MNTLYGRAASRKHRMHQEKMGILQRFARARKVKKARRLIANASRNHNRRTGKGR